jgi:peroxiredoxin
MGASRPEWGPPQPGDPAPDFDLVALGGNRAHLAEMRGSWVVLHFTATWCPFCDAEIEHLGELADAYAPYGVNVVVVDVLETAAKWEPYARARVAQNVVALHDEKGELARRYAPPRVQPSFTERAEAMLDATLVIDAEGRIRLFLIQDSAHFDPTFKAVRGELERMMGIGKKETAASTRGTSEPRKPETLLAPERVATIEVGPPPQVSAGKSGELAVKLRIAPGYHVMSDKPSAPNYIGTRVMLEPTPGLKVKDAHFPEAHAFKLVDESISTFVGDVDVHVPIEIDRGTAPGERRLKGTVRYQACTESSCLFPVTRSFETAVRISAEGERKEP